MEEGSVISWVDPDHGNKCREGRVEKIRDGVVTFTAPGASNSPMECISLHRVHSVSIIRRGGGMHGSWFSDV